MRSSEEVERVKKLLSEGLAHREIGQRVGISQSGAARLKGVYRLRIACDNKYADIIDRCRAAMAAVLPNKVGIIQLEGCVELYSDSKHWICLFPQHGPGRKHLRKIELEPWQLSIVTSYPKSFLKGLIESDGCRCINRVTVRGKRYEYLRYMFSNMSVDIQELFTLACDLIGVSYRQDGPKQISVARRESVALLDSFVGPKS